MTATGSQKDRPVPGKLSSTYFGPVYPEGPKFKNPETDLAAIGILGTWTIQEKPPFDEPQESEELRQTIQYGRHQKIREVENNIREKMAGTEPAVRTTPEYILNVVLDHIAVSDPEYEPDEPSNALVAANVEQPNVVFGAGNIVGGRCTKPGNIRLSIGNLICLGPSTYESVHGHSIAAILEVAWALWEIASSARRELTIKQVVVFRVMWELSGGQRTLKRDEILARARKDFESQGLGSLTEAELESILDELAIVKCIQVNALTPPTWSVRDQITYEYQ